jgi:porphobilinogen deaminase
MEQVDYEINIVRKENTLIIGSRGSKLALVQSEEIQGLLQKLNPEVKA